MKKDYASPQFEVINAMKSTDLLMVSGEDTIIDTSWLTDGIYR